METDDQPVQNPGTFNVLPTADANDVTLDDFRNTSIPTLAISDEVFQDASRTNVNNQDFWETLDSSMGNGCGKDVGVDASTSQTLTEVTAGRVDDAEEEDGDSDEDIEFEDVPDYVLDTTTQPGPAMIEEVEEEASSEEVGSMNVLKGASNELEDHQEQVISPSGRPSVEPAPEAEGQPDHGIVGTHTEKGESEQSSEVLTNNLQVDAHRDHTEDGGQGLDFDIQYQPSMIAPAPTAPVSEETSRFFDNQTENLIDHPQDTLMGEGSLFVDEQPEEVEPIGVATDAETSRHVTNSFQAPSDNPDAQRDHFLVDEDRQHVEGDDDKGSLDIDDDDLSETGEEGAEESEGDDKDGDFEDDDEYRPPSEPGSDIDGDDYVDKMMTGNEVENSKSNGKRNSSDYADDASKKSKKTRRKRVTSAREYWTRKYEDEEAAAAKGKKRKRAEPAKYPQKSAQRSSDGHSWERWDEKAAINNRAQMLCGIDDFETAVMEGNAPSMAVFTAKTKTEQFKEIKKAIPAGCDTRRAASQKKDLKEASESFGYKKVAPDGQDHKLKGMKTSLKNHQLTVASWMAGRENSRTAPVGGLLGDVMGMGKTVSSLALVIGHPPEKYDIEKYCKATLVIVPSSTVASQWQNEVTKHCEQKTSAMTVVYNRGSKHTVDNLKWQQIVCTLTLAYHSITSYNELLYQFPSASRVAELTREWKQDPEKLKETLQKESGDLFEIDWYRIILDEAHAIKNVTSRTALACFNLSAKYRWALTGTPLANKAEEFFPYMKFLGCNFTKNTKTFQKTYIKSAHATENLDAVVSLIMYRRTNKDTFLGRQMLSLPNAEHIDVQIAMSKQESIIFDMVELHYAKKSKQLKDKDKGGTLTAKEKEKQESLAHARYTRLRQVVSHTFCIEKMLRETFQPSELQILGDELKTCATKSLRKHLLDPANVSANFAQFFGGLRAMHEHKNVVKCLGGRFDMREILRVVENEVQLKNQPCGICSALPPKEAARAGFCGHVYCGRCLHNVLRNVERGPPCRYPGCTRRLALGDDAETLASLLESRTSKQKREEPGQDSNGVRIGMAQTENGMFYAGATKENMNIPPSAKLTAAMAVILTWQKESPNDKIIVFTQWIMSGKILGYMLQQMKIGFLYLYGSLNSSQRVRAIHDFEKDPSKKVMLIGLKCGGQALNLTMANKVILVDPWWNTTAEQQAFCRVYRMGQAKETRMVRIMTSSAIDERIDELQVKKSKEVDFALQDDGHKPTELDDERLKALFTPQDGDERE